MDGQIQVFLALVIVFTCSRIVKLWRGIKAVNYLPGFRVPFQPINFPSLLLPTLWWNPGLQFNWKWRTRLYLKNENLSVIPFLSGEPTIYTSNLDVARQVLGGHKSSFAKPDTAVRGINMWGPNILTTNGEIWRIHRRLMGPAFNNKTYQLVWDKTVETYHEMVACERWTDSNTADVSNIQSLMFKVTLLVVASCGFGFPSNWTASPAIEGAMSVQEALRIVSETIVISIISPKWAWNLPIQRMKEMRTAYPLIKTFIRAKIAERKAGIQAQLADGIDEDDSGYKDVFSMLVRATEGEAKLKLDDDELMGNVFILLIAGHETTAGMLSTTLAFLALYPDFQDEAFEQIISVVGNDRNPTFHDYPRLNKVLSVLYEALRMVPPAAILIRETVEDTVLNIPNPVGQEGSTTVPVPKGVQVIVDVVGIRKLENNPRYFDEPQKFKPSRWYDASSEEAVSTFSIGPRTCIGRKFATTEAVCFLTVLLRQWRVSPLMRAGEDLEGWRRRVFDAQIGITLQMRPVSVRFEARAVCDKSSELGKNL